MAYSQPNQLKIGLDEFQAAAANGENEKLLPYLERYEAFMNDPTYKGIRRSPYCEVQKALHDAARENHPDTVDLLLKRGFEIYPGRTLVFSETKALKLSSLMWFNE